MASVVSICNLALSHIGDEATVTSIDPPEGSQQAEHCQRYYPIARNTLLESHPWSFATRRIPLVERTEDPPAEWAFIYQRPNGCLKSLAVTLPESTDPIDPGEEFVEETIDGDVQVIYTNVEGAVLRYIVLVEDTTKYTALVVNALSRLLASYLAGPIIKGEIGMKIGLAQRTLYQGQDGKGGELALAKAADSNARRRDTYKDFTPSSIAARA
jgi:hypothetical protein